MISHFVRKKIFSLQLILSIHLLSGCASYKYPACCYYVPPEASATKEEIILYETYQEEALNHWFYRFVPRHRNQIRWYDLGHWLAWALLGNDDAGVFSEAHLPLFNPNSPIGIPKALAWMLRNPLHNFCYYVIGSGGCQNDEWTILKINRKQILFMKYNSKAHTVFGGRYTSFYLGFHGGKPLISLRLAYGPKWKSDFYIGWRDKGNFGIKFLPLTKISLAVWENLKYED